MEKKWLIALVVIVCLALIGGFFYIQWDRQNQLKNHTALLNQYYYQGQYDKAQSEVQALIALQPDNATLYLMEAGISCAKKDWPAMLSEYEQALSKNNGNFSQDYTESLLVTRSLLDYKTGNYQGAIDTSTPILATCSERCSAVHYIRGMSYYKLGQMDSAANEMMTAESLTGGQILNRTDPNFESKLTELISQHEQWQITCP